MRVVLLLLLEIHDLLEVLHTRTAVLQVKGCKKKRREENVLHIAPQYEYGAGPTTAVRAGWSVSCHSSISSLSSPLSLSQRKSSGERKETKKECRVVAMIILKRASIISTAACAPSSGRTYSTLLRCNIRVHLSIGVDGMSRTCRANITKNDDTCVLCCSRTSALSYDKHSSNFEWRAASSFFSLFILTTGGGRLVGTCPEHQHTDGLACAPSYYKQQSFLCRLVLVVIVVAHGLL